MIRYGIIGVSSIANRFAAGLNLTKDGIPYAISSRSLDKAKDFADKHNIPNYYGDYQQLIAAPSVDIVYISTTNTTHYEIAKQCLLSKKNCIVEKPFTITSEEANELFELAKTNNCFLMEGQKAVFLPTTQKIKELIDQDILGEIYYIYLPASNTYKFNRAFWMSDLLAGGGAVMGSANYALAFTSYLLNQEIIDCHSYGIFKEGMSDFLSSFSFQFKNGCIANTIVGSEIKTVNRCYVYGSKGYCYLDDFWKAKSMTLCLDGQQPQVFNYDYNSEFTFYLDHVNQLIKDNKITSPIMTPEITKTCVAQAAIIYQQYLQRSNDLQP